MALSFNIEQGERKYRTLLQDLITLSKSTSHPWLDIRLKSDDRSIILRFDSTNLDLLRFFTNDCTHSWDVRQYPTTDGVGNSYWEFLKSSPIGLDRFQCFTRVKRFELGYLPLRKSIHNLANVVYIADIANQDRERLAISMITITHMISKASRFKSILDHIVQSWWNPQPLTLQMVSVLTALDTGTFSRAKEMERLLSQPSLNSINTRSMCSINYVRVNDIEIHGQGEIEGDGENHSKVEIYGIHGSLILKQGLDSGKCISLTSSSSVVSGDIEEGCHDHKIYDRDSGKKENIGPGECISLTGPSSVVLGEDSFLIKVCLWNHNDEIGYGEIVWDSKHHVYDKHLEECVSGKHGSVTVGYSVISQAFSATIQVVIITSVGESPVLVYGTIKASYLLESGSSVTLMLFNDTARVRSQQSIPLTRPFLPVPVKSDLTIEIELWDDGWNHDDDYTVEDEIARGSLQFTPIIGTQTKNITGDYGQVQVSVTCQ